MIDDILTPEEQEQMKSDSLVCTVVGWLLGSLLWVIFTRLFLY